MPFCLSSTDNLRQGERFWLARLPNGRCFDPQCNSKRVTHRAVGEGEESEDPALLATKAAALCDLGLNYLVRARLVCSDAGEGSGLLPQEVYEDLPEVADLAR